MDEGGFILDYVMPPGSSLQETNRVVSHVEQIIRAVPEVESTSRRTGLQLGLAAVTEPNTGDIAVKLKDKRSRGIDDIISEVRGKVTTQEPALDVEFTQVLQDMICGSDRRASASGRPAVFTATGCAASRGRRAWPTHWAGSTINDKKPVVDIEDGIDNTTSGPAVVFTVNPQTAAKAGSLPTNSRPSPPRSWTANPPPTPVIINDRPYTLRVRYPEANRSSLEAMSNTMIVNSSGGTATLGSLSTSPKLPGQTEILRDNLQRGEGSHGAPGGRGPGHGGRRGAEGGERPEPAAVDPRGVWRHLPGTAEIVPATWSSCCCWRWS